MFFATVVLIMIPFEQCHLSYEEIRDSQDLRDLTNPRLCDVCKTHYGKFIV